jgi:hypothetical protein
MSEIINYGITVDSLNNKPYQRMLMNIIRSEIKEIDYKIRDAHEQGYNIITYNLCTDMNVDIISMRAAQLYVYSELIQSYKSRGFIAKIKLGDNPIIICKWDNKMCDDDILKYQKILSDNLLH